MSNLIVSLWRAQTFAYLAYYLSWFLFGFYQCYNLELVFISIPSSSSSKTDFICISSCVFGVGGFTGWSFWREVKLSLCCLLLTWWTMMFLCIILESSSLRFQRAQDHRNRSPDEKDIAVFILLFLSVFSRPDIPAQTWTGISGPPSLSRKMAKDSAARATGSGRIFGPDFCPEAGFSGLSCCSNGYFRGRGYNYPLPFFYLG